MKCKNMRLGKIIGAILFVAALVCGSFQTAAEGLNTTYARLANDLAGSIQKAACRDFSSQVRIQGITRDEMTAILAEDMALAKAERLGVSDMQRRAVAMSHVVPARYSVSRGRIYFVEATLRSRLENARLEAAAGQETIRLLLAYELTRVLMDQHCDLKSRLAEAGTSARSRALRAGVEGFAHVIVEKLAARRSRLALVPLAAGWPIGKDASLNAGRDIAAILDEEFDLCWSGGYRFAAYLADKHGMDAVYRACWAPPAELSLLYNPAGYKPETGPLPSQPAPSVQPGASAGTAPAGTVKPSPTGRLGPALLATRDHFPGDSWFEQAKTMDDLLKDMSAGEAAAFRESIQDSFGYRFVNLDLGAAAVVYGFKVGQEVTETDIQQMLLEVETSLTQSSEQDDMVYSPGDNMPLAGVGYGGSGWLQLGTMTRNYDEVVPCWLLVARTGDYAVTMFGMNFTLTIGQANALVNDVFDKLQ